MSDAQRPETDPAPSPQEAPTLPPTPAPIPVIPDVPPALADHPRYRIVKLLGAGGMGAVYHAEHCVMERPVALKVISRELITDPTAVMRFQREVKTAARLSHPNIVTAHDAEQAGDTHFLVMEFVEGVSLDKVVQRKGPLPVAFACNYIRQAALGLQHAHEQGMVHRDIKPQNLMLTPKGRVKILDFGLARFVSERGESLQTQAVRDTASGALTQANALMGTPDYIAPEQANDARRADIRADIYSFGCTLYFLLTGRPPFADGGVVQKLMAHFEPPPPPVARFRSGVPEDLLRVLDRMMAKDPAQRFATPAEVAKALAPFAGTAAEPKPEAAAAAPIEPSRQGPSLHPTAPPTGRRLAVWVTAGTVLGLGVIGTLLAVLTFRPRTGDPTEMTVEPPALKFPSETAAATEREVSRKTPTAPTPKTGTVFLEHPDGLRVRVLVRRKGEPDRVLEAGAAPQLEVPTGDYELALAEPRPDWRLEPTNLTVLERGRHVVGVKVAAPKKGRLVVDSAVPNVELLVKQRGKPRGTTQQGRVELDPGPYEVELLKPSPTLRVAPGRIDVAAEKASTVRVFRDGTYRAHKSFVVTLALHDRFVLSGGAEGELFLWDLDSDEPPQPLAGHQDFVRGVAFSPDGNLGLSGGTDGKVRLWDLETRTARVLGSHARGVRCVAFLPEGRHALSGGDDKAVFKWDVKAGKGQLIFEKHGDAVCSLAVWRDDKTARLVSPGGRPVLSGSFGGTVRLWNSTTGSDVWPQTRKQVFLDAHPRTAASDLALHPREPFKLVTAGHDGFLRLWNLQEVLRGPKVVRYLWQVQADQRFVDAVAFSPDGRWLFSGGQDGVVKVWDSRTGAPVRELGKHALPVRCLAVDPQGRFVISCSNDKTLRKWELSDALKPQR